MHLARWACPHRAGVALPGRALAGLPEGPLAVPPTAFSPEVPGEHRCPRGRCSPVSGKPEAPAPGKPHLLQEKARRSRGPEGQAGSRPGRSTSLPGGFTVRLDVVLAQLLPESQVGAPGSGCAALLLGGEGPLGSNPCVRQGVTASREPPCLDT